MSVERRLPQPRALAHQSFRRHPNLMTETQLGHFRCDHTEVNDQIPSKPDRRAWRGEVRIPTNLACVVRRIGAGQTQTVAGYI